MIVGSHRNEPSGLLSLNLIWSVFFRNTMACLSIVLLFSACDSTRVYEDNSEFTNRAWLVTEEPRFHFNIKDVTSRYNLELNIRNSLDYPFSRIFVMYHLYDSTDREISRKLVTNDLFDEKTGKPFGNSGLGDVYDHQFSLAEKIAFPFPGKFTIKLDQKMRPDTLVGVIAAGVRVELVVEE